MLGDLLSDFGDWLTGLSDTIGSAISAGFSAAWSFIEDWMLFGFDVATAIMIAEMNGIDVSIPTPGELMMQLPYETQQIIRRIGVPDGFVILSSAVSVRLGLWGGKVVRWMRSWG